MTYRRNYPSPRRNRDSNGHLIIDGYTFMGRNRIPPMPNRIALTDRTTGEVKVLGHDAGAGTLVLMDVLATWRDVQIYGKHEGPYTGNYRIFLDNGTVDAEPALDHSSARILTRRNFDTTVLELTVDTSTGDIVYTQVEL